MEENFSQLTGDECDGKSTIFEGREIFLMATICFQWDTKWHERIKISRLSCLSSCLGIFLHLSLPSSPLMSKILPPETQTYILMWMSKPMSHLCHRWCRLMWLCQSSKDEIWNTQRMAFPIINKTQSFSSLWIISSIEDMWLLKKQTTVLNYANLIMIHWVIFFKFHTQVVENSSESYF